ncbi:MAG TPA: antibiotic biosynthesis monooxygenase [Pyrinomonadaceae bacterium]|jgi:heme-degrading monooxygenase HmoA|nr:antibiotic biosynthesis monooxygenase [Pyrinomonadaceae bacterium]
MAFISVTRLRLRSLRYFLQFFRQSLKTARQAEHAQGFLGGKLLLEGSKTFWTITAWEDEASMRAYRNAGAHRGVMPSLLEWCDEASVAHWNQERAEIPPWQEAHRRMVSEGRLSKVNHPSPAQAARQIAAPRPGRIERVLKPAQRATEARRVEG